MAQVDLAKKYSNFFAPRAQVIVDNQDIFQKHSITASIITVEETKEAPSKFSCIIDDSQGVWINSALFQVGKAVEIKLGYANVLVPVINGEINSVKSIFPSSSPPQIQVFGEAKLPTSPVTNPPVYPLTYGSTLFSFISTVTAEKQAQATARPLKISTSTVQCSAECVGLPEIKVGVAVALKGLGSRFNKNYLVERVAHSWENGGFRTRFEAKMQVERRFSNRKSKAAK